VVEEIMDKETSRKLKIENLTRCMNCLAFVTCKEHFKEDVVDCDHLAEVLPQNQVVVMKMSEWSG
jgi:hypothetical protein